jgi:hypothetical protein
MAAQTMTERIRKLGPNPLKEQAISIEEVSAALEVAELEDENGFRGRKKAMDS